MNSALRCFTAGIALVAGAPVTGLAQPAAAGPKFLALAFSNGEHGWAAGNDGIDVTEDGGRTWRPQFRGRRVDQLVIIRRRSVYALADGAVLHTSDGGASWQLAGSPEPALKRIAFPAESEGFGVGADGLLYATADGAKTWHRTAFDRPVDAVCFSDRRTGFVGGSVSAPALGAFDGIAMTADGGRTWSDAQRPPTDGLVGIAGHTLYCTRGAVYDLIDLGPHAGGGAYVLARSTNRARSWDAVATGGQVAPLPQAAQGPGTEATSMSAYSAGAAYIAGFCGACGAAGQASFGASTGAGRDWQNVTLDAIGFTSPPVFTSPQHGWIGARVLTKDGPTADELLRTDDAGRTWTPIYTAR